MVASGGVGQGGPALGDHFKKFQTIDVGWSQPCYVFVATCDLLLYSIVWLLRRFLMCRPTPLAPRYHLLLLFFLEVNPILGSWCILSCSYSSHISVDSRVTADYLGGRTIAFDIGQ
jgi:hypothetical protein